MARSGRVPCSPGATSPWAVTFVPFRFERFEAHFGAFSIGCYLISVGRRHSLSKLLCGEINARIYRHDNALVCRGFGALRRIKSIQELVEDMFGAFTSPFCLRSSSSSTASSTRSPTPPTTAAASGLSTGAEIGIGVGVGVGVGVLAQLAIGICRLVRRRGSRSKYSKSLPDERFRPEEISTSEIPRQYPRPTEMQQPDSNPQTPTNWKPATGNSVAELPTKRL